jgi:hypothetical protein
MITCVIFISSLALNAGHQQFPATDQINRWFLTMRTCEFLILDGKNLVAPLAASYHRDDVDVQTGTSSDSLLTDQLETKCQRIGYNSCQRPHLKANTSNPSKPMMTSLFEHHIKHILSNRQFMHGKSLWTATTRGLWRVPDG